MDEPEFKKYEAHAQNGNFVLKTLLILLGGGLIATTNFFSSTLSGLPAHSNIEIDYYALMNSVKASYLTFLVGLIVTLISCMCSYFANRRNLEDDDNNTWVTSAIVLGIVGFLCLVAGLLFLLPAFSAFSVK